ncbi:MAG: hypothetical protein AAFP90_07690 [Planctomycetota bacterium]
MRLTKIITALLFAGFLLSLFFYRGQTVESPADLGTGPRADAILPRTALMGSSTQPIIATADDANPAYSANDAMPLVGDRHAAAQIRPAQRMRAANIRPPQIQLVGKQRNRVASGNADDSFFELPALDPSGIPTTLSKPAPANPTIKQPKKRQPGGWSSPFAVNQSRTASREELQHAGDQAAPQSVLNSGGLSSGGLSSGGPDAASASSERSVLVIP